MVSMYARASRVFGRNCLFFAGYAAVPTALDTFFQGSVGAFASIVLFSLLAFYSYRIVSSGVTLSLKESLTGRPKGPLGGSMFPFLWRYWVFGFLIFILLAVFAAVAFMAAAGRIALTPEDIALPSFAAASLAGLIPLSLIGTVLPASALFEDASVKRAFAIGRRSFWRTSARLLVGGGLVSVVSLMLTPGAFAILPEGFLMLFAAYLSSAYSIVLTATALCMAYEKGQPVSMAEVFS